MIYKIVNINLITVKYLSVPFGSFIKSDLNDLLVIQKK